MKNKVDGFPFPNHASGGGTCKDAFVDYRVFRIQMDLKREFEIFMEQTKLAWAAATALRTAKTEEERSVARAALEAAQAAAAAHDKHRQCSVCLKWTKTAPLAAVVAYVCTDPLCVRHVKREKTLRALYGSAPTFEDVAREYARGLC